MILYKDTVLMTGGPGGPRTDQSQNQSGFVWSVDSTSGSVLTNWTHGRNSHEHSPNDLFVLNDLVWSTAAGSNNPICTGYDRRTGAVVKTVDPHLDITWIHERCYRSKATTRYFITSRACLEFIDSQNGGPGVQDDWVRGACLYGLIPCNGLLYTTPNDCACQFEAKLTGLCALAPASTDTNYPPTDPDSTRLQPGPAYGQAVAANPSPDDWPMYRHDPLRSGYTTNDPPASLGVGWQAIPGGKLSSPTVAEGKVFVASVDTHTVWAFDESTGATDWTFMAGGRVDSPPTIYKGRVLFGAADGYVYCLRATDGALIWRFLAAPTDLRHMSYEQIESVWPVSGSVLVLDDKVYCVAGRSMFLDGGCRFVVLNPTNGVKLVEQVMDDKVPGTTNSLATLEKTFNGPVALADLLSSDGQFIYMKSQWFDLNGVRTNIGPISADVAVNASWANQVGEGVHLFTPTGFLDDNWMHRSYWVWGRSWSSGAGGYYQAGKNAPCGQIMSIDGANVYGFGRMPQFYQWTLPKENMLFSTSRANVFYSSNPYNWTNTLPLVVKAMVATGNRLFLAGPPELEDEEQSFGSLNDTQTQVVLANQDAALNGALGGQLRVVDKSSGTTLAIYGVNFLPVWDGMAVANQSLYLATRDGRVVCLR
jgi:outer membrane protein assembly factor BamB